MFRRFATPGRLVRTACSKVSFHASSDKGRRHDGDTGPWCDPDAFGTLLDDNCGRPHGGTPIQGTEELGDAKR